MSEEVPESPPPSLSPSWKAPVRNVCKRWRHRNWWWNQWSPTGWVKALWCIVYWQSIFQFVIEFQHVLCVFSGFDFGSWYPDIRFVNNKTHKKYNNCRKDKLNQRLGKTFSATLRNKKCYLMFWQERRWHSSKVLSWRKLIRIPLMSWISFCHCSVPTVRRALNYPFSVLLTIHVCVHFHLSITPEAWVLYSPRYMDIYIYIYIYVYKCLSWIYR